jgi:cardiolipin synthase
MIQLTGRAMGGQQPVNGATISLYKVNTSDDSGSSTSMLTTGVTTKSDGTFSISSDYACGTATDVYLTASGGDPGSGSNANLLMMAALGPCSSLSSSTFIAVNELSTVAAVAGLQPYMAGPKAVGSASYDAGALAADFTLANEYVGLATGAAPGSGVATGYSVPATLINTLGDILAPCINSTGGTAGQNNACGNLFTLATPPGGTAPTDTATALLDILNHPTLNSGPLYALIGSTPPYSSDLSAAPSSYSVALASPSAGTTITHTFYVFPETDNSVTPLYNLVNGAKSTIDMTMYEMQDTTMTTDLTTACKNGVRVRVIFSSSESSSNTTAYSALNSAGSNCSAVESNSAFENTHQKTITVDGALASAQTAILSLNLQTQYYSTTRDFALVENDPVDIAAIEATFNQDYAAGGTKNTTEFSYLAPGGDDLIWSPTTAQASLVNIINNATATLLIENEEMSADNIVSALENACQRGVTVEVAMTNDDNEYATEFSALQAAGCGVHTYVDNSSTLYIHAKAILADYNTTGVVCYMGSINFSTASMTENRELGLYVNDATSQQAIYNTITSDYAGGTNY